MATSFKNTLREIMNLAHTFCKRYGYDMSNALKVAWANIKLCTALNKGIVKFYFQKVDGSIRQAFGTLAETLTPETSGGDRKKNDTVQTYFDTEVGGWRCFKKANLIRIA